MMELNPFNWIEENEEKKPGKGRPNKVYSLKVRFKDIIAHLENQQKKMIDEARINIERLKELAGLFRVIYLTWGDFLINLNTKIDR